VVGLIEGIDTTLRLEKWVQRRGGEDGKEVALWPVPGALRQGLQGPEAPPESLCRRTDGKNSNGKDNPSPPSPHFEDGAMHSVADRTKNNTSDPSRAGKRDASSSLPGPASGNSGPACTPVPPVPRARFPLPSAAEYFGSPRNHRSSRPRPKYIAL
jgi:hypothetical protein